MTMPEAVREACAVFSLIFHSIGDYSEPADGFCDKCPAVTHGDVWHFQHSGAVFRYARLAIIEALKRDGFKIADGFDPVTGEEIE
jgi:hypothetical protein